MKKITISIFVCVYGFTGLLIEAYAAPGGSAASISPKADFTLAADKYKGQKGVRTDVLQTNITGVAAGNSVRFCLFIGNSKAWFNDMSACFDSKLTTSPANYPSLWFEFTNKDIEEHTGKGTHQLFVGLGVYTLDNLNQAFIWQTAPIKVTIGEEEKKVSEGKASGKVTVKVTDKTVEVSATTEYKGPNRRIDAFLNVTKGSTNPAFEDMPYTFEFRQGGEVKTGTATWSIAKDKFSAGNYTANVSYKGTGGSNLGNATSTNFNIEEEKKSTGGYVYDGPIIKIEIPSPQDYKDGLKGGLGTITFKGIANSTPFKCDMYVTRKWVGGAQQYSDEAISVRATPDSKNCLTQFGSVYLDGITNFNILNANSSNSVSFEVVWGNLRADFGNCPVQMRSAGKFNVSIEKGGYITANSPSGYHNKVPGFTVRNYVFPDSHLEIFKDSAKITIDTFAGDAKNAPLSHIQWNISGTNYSLQSVMPSAKFQEVKNSGCR